MNNYTKDLQVHSLGCERNSNGSSKSGFAWFIVRVGLICVCIFGAVSARIYLTAAIERLNKEVANIQAQTKEINIQIFNYRSKKERLTSWPYISNQIARYKMQLKEADYRQLVNIRLPDAAARKANGRGPYFQSTRTAGNAMTIQEYLRRRKQYSKN